MKPTRHRLLPSTRGVTLIELMIVIVILGILAAITGPSVRRTIERAAAKSNAREVANTLRMARNQAMSRGEVVLVRIKQATTGSRGSIEIYRSGDIGGGETTTVENDDGTTTTTTEVVPARNCRQTGLATWNDPTNLVHTMTLNGASGESELTVVDPFGSTAGLDLCFSPDGRVLLPSTAAVPTPAKYGGCDENIVLVLTDDRTTPEMLGMCGGTLPEAPPVDPILVRDQRELINLYRVTLSYNGGVKVVQ